MNTSNLNILNSIYNQLNIQNKPLSSVVDPRSGQIINPTILWGMVSDFMKNYQTQLGIAQSQTQAPSLNPPTWTKNETPSRFQYLVQNYIRDLPFEYQLNELNKIQNDCPFLVIDPLQRRINVQQPLYGLADLYRFLGLGFNPLGKGSQLKVAKIEGTSHDYRPLIPPGQKFEGVCLDPKNCNPFYHPVKYAYNIPDYYGNQMMWKMYQQSPLSMYYKMSAIYNRLLPYMGGGEKMTGGGLGDEAITESYDDGSGITIEGGKNSLNGEDKNFYIEANMKDLVELWKYIANFETNPERAVRFMKLGDIHQRPMEGYLQNNFDTMLYEFLLSHAVYKIDNYKPKRNIEIGSASLDRYKRSRQLLGEQPLLVSSHAYSPSKDNSEHRSEHRSKHRSSSKRRSSKRRSSKRSRSHE